MKKLINSKFLLFTNININKNRNSKSNINNIYCTGIAAKKNFSVLNFFSKIFNNKQANNKAIDNTTSNNSYKNNENNTNTNTETLKTTNSFIRNRDKLKEYQSQEFAPDIAESGDNNNNNNNNNNTPSNDNQIIMEHASKDVSDIQDEKLKQIELLKEKYELYKSYEKADLLQKDADYGEIIKYEDFLDKGLDRFEGNLSKLYNINKNLDSNKSFQELSKLVDEKSKLFYSNYKEEYKYNLAPYEERWYKEAIHSKLNNDFEFIKIADNMKKRPSPIRNRVEFAEILESTVKMPMPASYPTKVETPFEAFIDPFQYLFNKGTKETKRFLLLENQFKNKTSFKYSHIYQEVLEEFTERELLSPKCAFQLNEELICFKQQDDDFSVYAVDANSVEPSQRGIITNEYNPVELFELDKLSDNQEAQESKSENFFSKFTNKEKNNKRNKTRPNSENNKLEIKQLFGLEDLVCLNSVYSDPVFLEFSKRLLEKIELEETALENFEICPKNNFLLLFFNMANQQTDMDYMNKLGQSNEIRNNSNAFNFASKASAEQNRHYDILIKDLKNNLLLPIVLHNCDISIAFDNFDGIFYTQKDLTDRFCKVFRHQIGLAQSRDKLIYHEKNKDFKVSTYNCNSKEYIYLEISTVLSPKVNEIWFKPTNDLDKVDFICFKKIEKNVNYRIKFSNNAFYMLANKTDSYDKVLKKIIWSKNNRIAGLLEASEVAKAVRYPKQSSCVGDFKIQSTDIAEQPAYKQEENTELKINKINSHETSNREGELVTDSNVSNKSALENFNNLENSSNTNYAVSPITARSDITSDTEKNIIADVFSDLIALNRASTNLIKIIQDIVKSEDNINIIDFQVFNNYVALLEEVDKKRQIKVLNQKTNSSYIHEPEQENGYITFSENSFFKSNYLRYVYTSPIESHTVVDYSLGTRKSYKIHKNFYSKVNFGSYQSEILSIPDRENQVNIPVHIYYNKNLLTSDSPVIIYTKGAQSQKKDLEFDSNLISLLDRGFVYAVPQLRGTKFFDFDWYAQGIAENKIKHFTDFIDCATHFLDKKISERLILYGDGYSGSITASVAFLQSPDDYSMLVANNGAFDVLDLCMFGSNNISILEEFGDCKNKIFYELMKMYSPYHSSFPISHPPVYISAEEDNEFFAHSMKLVAKLRQNNKKNKFRNNILFETFDDKYNYDDKIAAIYANIIGNIYHK